MITTKPIVQHTEVKTMLDFVYEETPDYSCSIHQEFFTNKSFNREWDIPISQLAYQHLAKMSNEEMDREWKLDDFFGVIAVINLSKAKIRLKQVKAELKHIGIDEFYRFPAIDGRKNLDPSIWKKMTRNRMRIDVSTEKGQKALDSIHQGEAGCFMSHYKLLLMVKKAFDHAQEKLDRAIDQGDLKAMKLAKKEVLKYSRILILEDDCGFGIVNEMKTAVNRKGTGLILRDALSHLPDDWDMLYFVAQATDPTEEIAPHLRKLKRSFSCVAYAIHYPMYAPLIDVLKKIEDPAVVSLWPLDNEISNIHEFHKVYAISPSLAYHHIGQSFITTTRWEKLWQGQTDKPL